MIRVDRTSWRLGWLAAGLAGLIALSFLPGLNREPPMKPTEALVEALWYLNEDRLGALLEAGVDPNLKLDARDTRPLHLLFFGPGCALNERPTAAATLRIAALLVERGADVNAADQRRNTPLMLAAAECDAATVRQLLVAGADMYQTNLLGLTPFEMTLANVSDAADALIEAGYRLSPEAAQLYRMTYHDENNTIDLIDRASR